MKLKALASALWMGAKRHSPEILVGLGIAGAASSVIFAIKATPKAMILLEEKRQDLGVEKLEAKEIIKTAAPVYIPTAVSFGVSVACIIGASSVNARRNAALTAAYTLSEDFVDMLVSYAETFDPNTQVSLTVKSHSSTQDISAMLKNAQEIQMLLLRLAIKLVKISKEVE